MTASFIAALVSCIGLVCGQYLTNGTFLTEGEYNVRYDTGTFGPEVEEFHYFFDQWHYAFTVGLLENTTYEDAYPSVEINTPIGDLITYIDGVAPDSYLLDVRFNLLSNVTDSGAGIAYIVDSPPDSNRTALIMFDLGSGECWRRLESDPSTLPVEGDVPSYNGVPFYPTSDYRSNGLYGIELSYYGDTLYYHSKSSEYLYSIPTSLLNSANASTDATAQAAVQNLGQKGGKSNGSASDSNGMVYMLMPESNAIYLWNSTTGAAEPYMDDNTLA
ncbi:hypothetical protein N0V93_004124 [Gnomoniopsis smithogilvyi]|uniref:Uncharacterized protein n=1 Tax=Gnomoniopsis smithogilvyi TaxID=1191159 RepID=A0A9W9D0S4_9PEZI|nr:hypothetical protein N0V93_004124 [Gnomoniopsis smithogilvyi]